MKRLLIILILILLSGIAYSGDYTCGDIDKDGLVTIDDWYMVHQHMEGERDLSEFEFPLADVYPDNKINIIDMILINLASIEYFELDLLICAEPPEYILNKVTNDYRKGERFEVEGSGIYADKIVEVWFKDIYYLKDQSEINIVVLADGVVVVDEWVRLGVTNKDFVDELGRKVVSDYFKIVEAHSFLYGSRYLLIEQIEKKQA